MPADLATLDPPGTIAVIGGGALGVEAALYGRFLGYTVTLVEAKSIGNSAEPFRDEPLPVLPDRCLSPLAMSALSNQVHDSGPQALPTTVGQWIDEGLLAITQTDLLRGCVRCQTQVTAVDQVPVMREEPMMQEEDGEDWEEDHLEDLPDDFCLHLQDADGETTELVVEAVIVATGNDAALPQAMRPATSEYLFRIGADASGDVEKDLRRGYQEIVAIFAGLAGRESLDLYRPRRL